MAAFSNANEADASPNTRGAKCLSTGQPCDEMTSTCNGLVNIKYNQMSR